MAGKKTSRRKNPVPLGKIARATKRFENFKDHESKVIKERESPDFSVAIEIGTLDYIGYTTKRGKKKRVEKYEHMFKGRKPVLAVTEDGRTLFTADGHFEFTERGFVDK